MTSGLTAALLAGASLLGAAALRPGPVVRRYSFTTDRLRPGGRFRFAVASDLHHITDRRLEKLLMLLAREKPDYILLPGDLFDEQNHPRHAREFLRSAAKIAPAFFCPGNHEYYTGHPDAILRAVERLGVTVLRDSFACLETRAGPVLLAGCDDPRRRFRYDPAYRPAKAARAAFDGVSRGDGLRVLLAHRPELAVLYGSFGFDLAVSGHAHGGQVRIPFLLNGLYAPGQGFFPPLAGGLYELGDTAARPAPSAGIKEIAAHKANCASGSNFKLAVSRGVGDALLIPRVFNPSELAVLDISGESGFPNSYRSCTECKK